MINLTRLIPFAPDEIGHLFLRQQRYKTNNRWRCRGEDGTVYSSITPSAASLRRGTVEGKTRGKKIEKMKKVMVAIDESECSHYALEWTLYKIKDSIAESEVIIFTVQPFASIGYVHASTLGTTPPELIKSIQENQNRVALALLERAKEICAKHGIVAETVTEIGDPKEAICAAVEKLNIELLVLGSHNRGAIGRAFLGSVSNYCLHNAKCPVLVVKKDT